MRYISNVATLTYDASRCTGCSRCTQVCPHNVFVMVEHKAHLADLDACMECGACMRNCAFGAIKVNSGVGCAAAMINGLLKYGDPDKGSCDCTGESGCC